MFRGTLAIAAATVLLAVALIGCGGGAGSNGTTSGSASSSAASTEGSAGGTTSTEGGSTTEGGGRGEGGGEGGESQASKTEFGKQATAICEEARKNKEAGIEAALKEEPVGEKGLSKKREEALVTEVVLPPIKTMTEELAELQPAPSEEKEAAAVVAAFEQAVGEVEADPGLVLGSDNPFVKADGVAQKYGLSACTVF